MSTKSHNAKKPKLASHQLGHGHEALPSGPASLEGALGQGSAPEKHRMSFAQHQHERLPEHAASPVASAVAPAHQLKSDAQQHQQKAHSHK